MTDEERGRGVGKKIARAIGARTLETLDLATIIYAARNWTIHGVLASTSFRGGQTRMGRFFTVINISLARILEGSIDVLEGSLS